MRKERIPSQMTITMKGLVSSALCTPSLISYT